MEHLDLIMKNAGRAFETFRYTSGDIRKTLLYYIAEALESDSAAIISAACTETNLPEVRFSGELARTCMQLRMFGDIAAEGSWVEAVIDTAEEDRKPLRRPDIRKMLIPCGPVLVFGASNFPLAYSTPGGDTASALAAGCPVVVKMHPAHPVTARLCRDAISRAIEKCALPPSVFQLVEEAGFEAGKYLVQHPLTAGVGFTGSLAGGRAIYDYAQQRDNPVPVFSEMGSVNPVILMNDALTTKGSDIARTLGASILMGVGQFCTNPGILIGISGKSLDEFMQMLAGEISRIPSYKMLHRGIYENYHKSMDIALGQKGVDVIYEHSEKEDMKAPAVLARVNGKAFLENPRLREEVFGPFSLFVCCDHQEELEKVWSSFEGQLTTTIFGTDQDLRDNQALIRDCAGFAGRIVFNGAPTGVEVAHATVHGGPYPATTDGRVTSVGADAIKRWVRPVCWQDCPDFLLPDALKSDNPLNLWRKINTSFSKEKI